MLCDRERDPAATKGQSLCPREVYTLTVRVGKGVGGHVKFINKYILRQVKKSAMKEKKQGEWKGFMIRPHNIISVP